MKKGRGNARSRLAAKQWISMSSRIVQSETKQFRIGSLVVQRQLVVFSRSLTIYLFLLLHLPFLSVGGQFSSSPDSVPYSCNLRQLPLFQFLCQPHLPCSDAYLSPTSKPPCLLFSQHCRRPSFLLHLRSSTTNFHHFIVFLTQSAQLETKVETI